MGLFSSILHLRPSSQDQAVDGLISFCESSGFRLHSQEVVSDSPREPEADAVAKYFVSNGQTPWITVIEAVFPSPPGLHLSDLGRALSARLRCYALDVIVHDGDVLFYDLHHLGEQVDGYNSCPQYFESVRLSEADIQAQRHTPAAFSALLPARVTLMQLESLLQKGWWSAHDRNRLDEDGLALDDDDLTFGLEGERMSELGTLLELAGPGAPYPYAAWAEDPRIRWQDFTAVTFAAQQP